MNDASHEAGLPHGIARPRPVRMPSRSAQAALLVAGATALFLFVMQLTAPGQQGLLNGRGTLFDGHSAAPHRAPR